MAPACGRAGCYKPHNQSHLVPITLNEHIYEGSLEEAIHLIVEEQIDLSGLNDLYKNDDAGRPAIHPKVLLKVILLAYARGVTGSRPIERACHENVLFMALVPKTGFPFHSNSRRRT